MIFNFDIPESNSRIIFDLVISGKLEGVISEKAITEVKRVFSLNKNERFTHQLEQKLRKNFKVVPLYEIEKEMQELRGKIKEKDLEHLATAKHVSADYIIAFDRDFEPFKEYITPRKFVEKILKFRPFETEY